MKSTFLALLIAPVIATSVAVAQQPSQEVAFSDRPLLVARKTDEPVFPRRLEELGINEGEVRVVISVNPEGRVTEALAIGYTHPLLADVSVATVKRWEFEKPTWRGQPVSVQREVKFVFENHQSVISMDLSTFMDVYLGRIFNDRFVYRPRTLKELDKIPVPITAQAPVIATSTIQKGSVGTAVVEFYIDDSGTVRMPSLVKADDPELGSQCAEAVRTWKFEPPTVQGRPVLVRAQQTFRFAP